MVTPFQEEEGGTMRDVALDTQTVDRKYMGPTIGWNGGTPMIIPSDFPRMYQ